MGMLTTARLAWQHHRDITLADSTPETALAVAAKTWAAIIAAYSQSDTESVVGGLFKLSARHNKIAIRLRSTATNNDTFGGVVYLIKKGEDAKLACTFTGIIGQMVATKKIGGAAATYADSITVTNYFLNVFASVAASADDMGLITGDCAGWDYALVLITDTNAGVVTEKIAVDITGW